VKKQYAQHLGKVSYIKAKFQHREFVSPKQILDTVETLRGESFTHPQLRQHHLSGAQVSNMLIPLVMQAERIVLQDNSSVTGVDDDVKKLAARLSADYEFIGAVGGQDISTMVRVAMEEILISERSHLYERKGTDPEKSRLAAIIAITARDAKRTSADTMLHADDVPDDVDLFEEVCVDHGQSAVFEGPTDAGRFGGVFHAIDEITIPDPPKSFEDTTALIALKITDKSRGSSELVFFEKSIITIGRGTDNDLFISTDPHVSRNHAQLFFDGTNLHIVDLSTHGTFVNGRRIASDREVVRVGHKITVGETDKEIVRATPNKSKRNLQAVHPRSPCSGNFMAICTVDGCPVETEGERVLEPIELTDSTQRFAFSGSGQGYATIEEDGNDELCICWNPGDPVHSPSPDDYITSIYLPGLNKSDEFLIDVTDGFLEIKNCSEMSVKVNGVELPNSASSQVFDGDIIQIEGYLIFINLNKENANYLSEYHHTLYEVDPEFGQRLRLVEDATKTMPQDLQEQALWVAMWFTNHSLKEIYGFSGSDRKVEYERRMANIDFLISSACVSEQQEQFFRFIRGNYARAHQFAAMARTFNGIDMQLRSKVIEHDVLLSRKLEQIAKSEQRFDEKLSLIMEAIPSDLRTDNFVSLCDDLNSHSFMTRARAIRMINEQILNPRGILLWEDKDKVIISEVFAIVYVGSQSALIINQIRGVPPVFDDGVGGFFHHNSEMILIKKGSEKWTEEAAYHEVQHACDYITRFIEKVNEIYKKVSPTEQKLYIEATAIAAELYHSKYSNAKIRSRLFLNSGSDEYALARKRIHQFVQKHSNLPIKDALIEYINAEYERILGIKYTTLFDGRRSTLHDIVYGRSLEPEGYEEPTTHFEGPAGLSIFGKHK